MYIYKNLINLSYKLHYPIEMVARLLLLKLLSCNRLKRRNLTRGRAKDTQEQGEGSSTVNIKKEIFDYNETATAAEEPLLCRVCLNEGHIPIFGDELSEDISESLSTFANIEMSATDTYPKFLCTACHSLLQGAILFRKTAQRSDKMLKKPKKEQIITNQQESDVAYSFDDDDNFIFDVNMQKEEKTYHCTKCELDFKNLEDITHHRKTTDHKNMKQQCPICHKAYGMAYFKRHMAYHKMDTPYVCDVCGKAFIMQGHFTRHRLTHDYDLPYQCSICPYRGRFSESLKMHMRRHTGEKPYQCSECPVRCINMSNLKRHMNTHKKEHDFKCDTCGKGFFTRRDLNLHFKVDHTGIKDHICNICGKAFGYRKQMMKHQLKVHKREKLQNGRMPLYLQIEQKKLLGEMV